jgi:hypothetical protein
MCAKADETGPRDHAFARVIAEALKPAGSSAAASALACPDAEVVAAYADRGLADGERAQMESHFAVCDRCQKILATLGAGLQGGAAAGESVAVLPSGPALPQPAMRPSASSEGWVWWLSAAFGTAAAVLLWVALRPLPPGAVAPVQTAANYSRPTGEEGGSAAAPAASLSAGRVPPSAPSRDAQAFDDLSKAKQSDRSVRNEPLAQPGAPADATREPAVSTTAQSEVAGALQPRAAVGQAVSAPAAAAEPRPLAPAPAQGPGAQNRAVTAQSPPDGLPPSTNQTVVVTEMTPLAGRAVMSGVTSAQRQQQTDQPARAAPIQINLYTFSPPDGSATWRLGTRGGIERSTDKGRTWEPQSSGVTVDLIAGSASSKDVAWVVGRGHAILRTTDGEHWEPIAGPAGVTADWAVVAAHSEVRATVVTSDLRSFATEDGGRTWTQQRIP